MTAGAQFTPFTELNDRLLRFDGVSVLEPEQIGHFLLSGMNPSQIRVGEMTPEIERFNENVLSSERISANILEDLEFDYSWKLPQKYLAIDISEHVMGVFSGRIASLNYTPAQTEQAILRVDRELKEYETRNLHDLLRAIIYILDRFKSENQVYGVGRGSSCASYILFLLGLHLVDSIKYEVPLDEFFHD